MSIIIMMIPPNFLSVYFSRADLFSSCRLLLLLGIKLLMMIIIMIKSFQRNNSKFRKSVAKSAVGSSIRFHFISWNHDEWINLLCCNSTRSDLGREDEWSAGHDHDGHFSMVIAVINLKERWTPEPKHHIMITIIGYDHVISVCPGSPFTWKLCNWWSWGWKWSKIGSSSSSSPSPSCHGLLILWILPAIMA